MRYRIFFFSILLISACPAVAGPREDTLAGISRCAGLPDDHVFLDCIYGAAQPMRAKLGLSPAPTLQQRLVPPPDAGAARDLPPRTDRAATSSDGFLSRLTGTGPDLHMAAYSFDKRGLFTVTLSNGEVWRQDTSDSNFAHFGGKASDYPVTIVQGDFGKSRLDVRGEPGPYIVDRVK